MNPVSTNKTERPPAPITDVWAVPSISGGMMATSADDAASHDDHATNKNETGPSVTSVEDAWTKIQGLRSLLASDVIMDPADDAHNFPTFVSPFESPSASHAPQSSYKGMPIPLLYCDHTASHRPLSSIENYLRRTSLPCHANTHTNITYTGSQSTAFVSEARQIVAETTGARVTGKASLDCVIFGGNGVTGAVAILIDCLNLRSVLDRNRRPVAFVGPHEHHSNLLPWRESGCEVVAVPERRSDGTVDLDELDRLLELPRYSASSGRLRMGIFSAASNVTGLIADVDAIAIVLHRHGALAFFDYATGAAYLKMDVNSKACDLHRRGGVEKGAGCYPEEGEDVDPSKDAIYFSPHKCFGGTSTPGVLVIKKRLISQTNPPLVSGGGTVFYVTNQDHRFLSNRIERYEGGTPDGVGIQRVGLALLAGRRVASEYERIARAGNGHSEKDGSFSKERSDDAREGKKITGGPPNTLLEFECLTHDRVVAELKKRAPNLILLGCDNNRQTMPSSSDPTCVGRHLPIFSFLIRCGRRFLHYNYVCALLNDLFGIQSRGGCQCAGPYSQRLLGLTKMVALKDSGGIKQTEVPNEANRKIERALLRSDRPCELLRPGVRFCIYL